MLSVRVSMRSILRSVVDGMVFGSVMGDFFFWMYWFWLLIYLIGFLGVVIFCRLVYLYFGVVLYLIKREFGCFCGCCVD